MANNITFNRGEGGLGRPLASSDHVSGIVFYTDAYVAGITANDNIAKVNSLAEAVALGITTDHSDETAATGGNYNFTAPGSAGDVLELYIDEGDGVPIKLAEYTVVSGDGNNDVATGLRADGNDLTKYSHGYTLGGSTSNVALTAPAGLGANINASGLTLVKTPSGSTAAATITQFSGGVDGFLDVVYYHVSEYFRMNPKGSLYIGFFDESSLVTSAVSDMQAFANGEIRQVAVFNNKSTFASSDITSLQTVADTLEGINRPLSILLHSDMTGLTLSSQPNLTTLSSKNVSMVITQDARTSARLVFNKKAFTVSCLGAVLGAVSYAKVHENIAWVSKFNFSDGTNLESIKFLPSTGWSSASESLKAQLDTYGYIFLQKFVDYSGTFANGDKTATSSSSDYARVRNNRAIDKAVRLLRARLLPLLSSPLYVNADGTLQETTIAVFENEGNKVIGGRANSANASGQMIIDGELSAGRTIIDPTQDVLGTSQITVTAELIPVGSAETIVVNIGFVASFA